MPLHEYKCVNCNKIQIKLFFGTEKVLDHIECDECEFEAPKIVSAPEFHIKGYSSKNNYSNEDHGQGSDGPRHQEYRDPKGKTYDKNKPPPKRLQKPYVDSVMKKAREKDAQ